MHQVREALEFGVRREAHLVEGQLPEEVLLPHDAHQRPEPEKVPLQEFDLEFVDGLRAEGGARLFPRLLELLHHLFQFEKVADGVLAEADASRGDLRDKTLDFGARLRQVLRPLRSLEVVEFVEDEPEGGEGAHEIHRDGIVNHPGLISRVKEVIDRLQDDEDHLLHADVHCLEKQDPPLEAEGLQVCPREGLRQGERKDAEASAVKLDRLLMICLKDLPVVTLPVLVSSETHKLSCAMDFVEESVNVQYAYQDGQPDHP